MSLPTQMLPEIAALKLGAGKGILSACELLRAQWPFTQYMPRMPPIFLLHQIYFLLDDRTQVDRELSQLQQSNQIRVFKIFAQEGNDLCIVLTDDYIGSIYALLPDGAIITGADLDGAPAERPLAANLARPATMPAASSSAAAAASPSAPVKAQSAVTPRFAAWPSSGKSTFAEIAVAPSSIVSSTATTAEPSRESSILSHLPPTHSTSGAAAAASSASASSSKPPIKRKRSQPLPAPAEMAASSNGALKPAAARAASADARAASTTHRPSGEATPSVKRQKLSELSSSAGAASQPVSLLDDDGPPTRPSSASAAAAPPTAKIHGGEVFLANPASGGQNPKLHVGLNDLVDDERFPATQIAPKDSAGHFSTHDAGVLLGAFLERLVPCYTDISITEERLMALLDQQRISRLTQLTRETIVSCLLHMGLLLFKTATSFFFSPPSIARLISCVRCGRKEVVAILKRRQYKEMPLREMLQKPQLKTSPCRIEFHLREMLGSAEIIEMTDTTIGPLVKLVKR